MPNGPCGKGTCEVWTNRRVLESLPREAPGRGVLAPPVVPEGQYWFAGLMVAVGAMLALTGGGGLLLGLLLMAGGIGFGVYTGRTLQRARDALAAWEEGRYCVTCDRALPDGGGDRGGVGADGFEPPTSAL